MAVESPASFVEAAELLVMFVAGADTVSVTVAAAVETDYSKKHPKMTPATDSEPPCVEPDPFVEYQGASRACLYLNSAGIVNYSTRCCARAHWMDSVAVAESARDCC